MGWSGIICVIQSTFRSFIYPLLSLHTELSLMSGFLPLSLRCSSLGQRSRWVTAIRKFLERVHAVGRRAAMR